MPCHLLFRYYIVSVPIPVAALSKTLVWRRSLVGTAGSNPAVEWISLTCEFCVLSGRGFLSVWSLVQRSPTECGLSKWDCKTSMMRRPWPTRGCCAMGGKKSLPRWLRSYTGYKRSNSGWKLRRHWKVARGNSRCEKKGLYLDKKSS
jgi:hypothetical protein